MVCGHLVVYVYAYTSREIGKRERERERAPNSRVGGEVEDNNNAR